MQRSLEPHTSLIQPLDVILHCCSSSMLCGRCHSLAASVSSAVLKARSDAIALPQTHYPILLRPERRLCRQAERACRRHEILSRHRETRALRR